ncbi:MAG TPA: entericidin A/B family lipoprotein [Rhodocyclaceae bacterium]|nr:entericidin A/B family lipoprotein [Rhodocyclaceae bacterium]
MIALSVLLGLLLSACNTVEGFGKDVQKAGGALERAADKAKN